MFQIIQNSNSVCPLTVKIMLKQRCGEAETIAGTPEKAFADLERRYVSESVAEASSGPSADWRMSQVVGGGRPHRPKPHDPERKFVDTKLKAKKFQLFESLGSAA